MSLHLLRGLFQTFSRIGLECARVCYSVGPFGWGWEAETGTGPPFAKRLS